ncbi:MAG: indolepyruvate oxidoreductase subunit beta [Clostridia bacterium]|nr:indolepyruvate oxidoreductase subunit beta [Clostridia bacterium]
MNKNILLCGVGGQGTVLASKLLAAAAMAKDINVMSAETIGMAQRGGSVFSHLRMGDDIYSPMLAKGTADIIIGFEPAEAVRMLDYLKPDGLVVTNSNPIMPVTAALKNSDYTGAEMIDYIKKQVKNLIVIDGKSACEALGSGKVLNMVLLGAALGSGNLPVTIDDLKEAIKNKLKPEMCELNFRALEYAR